jgi:hypothetical protein
LTSSHKSWPRPKVRPYSWCLFKRPQIRQCRDGLVRAIARAPPPAFLFPNQRCQRPDRACPTPLFSAGGRRRRLSIEPLRRCQPGLFRPFRRTPDLPKKPRKLAQKPHRAAEGQPSLVGGDSIGARENTHPEMKIKGNFAPVRSPRFWAPPEREAAIYGAAPGVSIRSFQTFPPHPRSSEEAQELDGSPSGERSRREPRSQQEDRPTARGGAHREMDTKG